MKNRTFRLFVSSTFSDFIKEREILNSSVYNKVNDYLKKYDYTLQIIDLRWGINTEAALNQNTLDLCINEVKRCKTLSPKPNFLIMAGERYGWVPLPYSIEKDEFRKIEKRCTKDEEKLLNTWYKIDLNSMPVSYFLCAREGQYTDNDIWAKEEERLQSLLVSKAAECGFSPEQMVKYTASATEHEILEGLLNDKGISDNVIVLMRSSYPEKDENPQKIDSLKQRIKAKMQDDLLEDNIIELEYSDTYYETLENEIVKTLIHNIEKEIKNIHFDEENGFLPDKNRTFCAREDTLAALDEYTNAEDDGIFYLTGSSGCGKTAVLKEYILRTNERLNSKNGTQKIRIVSSFFGENGVYTAFDCFENLCSQLLGDTDKKPDINPYNISDVFCTLVNDPYQRTLAVIDSLDMLDGIEEICENIFPDSLEKRVKIVVSCARDDIALRFARKKDTLHTMGPFSAEDSRRFVELTLKKRGICINNSIQKKEIENTLSQNINPLTAKLISDIAAKWHYTDECVCIPETDFDMAKMHITQMYEKLGHKRELVEYALSFIAAAPFGISEEELITLLFRVPQIRDSFFKEDRYGYKVDKLPFALWSRLFYDMSDCLLLSKTKNSIVVGFNHNIFKSVVLNQYNDKCEYAKKLLCEYYLSLDNYCDEKKTIPNTRKIASVIYLLEKAKDYQGIQKLINDFGFVDAMVKSGNPDDFCALCERMSPLGIQSTFYRCTKENLEHLRYYRDFFNVCMGEGIAGIENPNSSLNTFLHSKEAKLKYNPSSNRYAVINGVFVHLFKNDEKNEYCKIYIHDASDTNDAQIADCVWIGERKIAVTTTNGKVFLYLIEDNIPKMEKSLSISSDMPKAVYCPKENLLLTLCKGNIHATDCDSYETVYKIKISGERPFDFLEEDNTINVYTESKQILKYSAKDGSLAKKINLTEKWSFYHTSELYCISKGCYVIISFSHAYEIRLVHPDGKLYYIYLPRHNEAKSFLVGKRYLAAVYDDMVILCDILDGGTLLHKKIPGIRGLYCIKEDCEFAALTTSSKLHLFADSFERIQDADALMLKKSLTYAHDGYFYGIYNILRWNAKILLKGINKLSFEFLFTRDNPNDFFGSPSLGILFENYLSQATFTHTKGNLSFVAYEGRHLMRVFDGNGELLLEDKKTAFSMDNSIIKVFFSSDNRFLCVYMTQGIAVFDLNKKKKIINFCFGTNPPEDAVFADDAKSIVLKYPNQKIRTISLFGRLCALNKKDKTKTNLTDEDFESFGIVSLAQLKLTETFMSNDFERNRDIQYKMLYKSKDLSILFDDGKFYKNADKEKQFENGNCNFKNALAEELRKCTSLFAKFVHIKNDLSSELFDYSHRGYALLVSKILNSVIVFDLKEMKIAEARKIYAPITQIHEENGNITLWTDQGQINIELEE